MYVFLSFTIQVGDSLYTVQLHWQQSFVFSMNIKKGSAKK